MPRFDESRDFSVGDGSKGANTVRSDTDKVGGGLVAVMLSIGAWGCEDSGKKPLPAPAPTAETVESRPGIVQAGDDDGATLSEAETCARFRDGVVRNRERLACEAPPLLVCPELIRPLASLGCVTYSEASLTACLAAYDQATDCEALVPGACILTAVLYELDPACAPDAPATTETPSSAPPDAAVTSETPSSGRPDASTAKPDGAVGSDAGTDGETQPTEEDTATRPDAALDAGPPDAGPELTATDGG